MKQLSLVSFYNHLPTALEKLVIDCQSLLTSELGQQFEAVDLSKVHSTLVSLERLNDKSFLNKNFSNLRNENKEMDFTGLLNFIKTSPLFPFTVQVGGFKNKSYHFQSQQESPYFRSFSFRNDIAVAIGWPKYGNEYPLMLYQIRKQLEAFNILYSYHANPSDIDNDFYFRIGYVTAQNDSDLIKIEYTVRDYLSKRAAVFIEVGAADLDLVIFESPSLPAPTTQCLPLLDPQITTESIKSLYLIGS